MSIGLNVNSKTTGLRYSAIVEETSRLDHAALINTVKNNKIDYEKGYWEAIQKIHAIILLINRSDSHNDTVQLINESELIALKLRLYNTPVTAISKTIIKKIQSLRIDIATSHQ